jgi:hypothetical protein
LSPSAAPLSVAPSKPHHCTVFPWSRKKHPNDTELVIEHLDELIFGLPSQLAVAGELDFNLAGVDTSLPDIDDREPREVYHDVLRDMFGSRVAAGKSTESSKREAYRLSTRPSSTDGPSPERTPIVEATQHDSSVLWGRGPYVQRIVEGFIGAVTACPGDGVILKWLDDVVEMAEQAYAFCGKQVRMRLHSILMRH